MRRSLLLSLFLLLGHAVGLAQTDIMRQVWINQNDSTTHAPFRPEFIEATPEQITEQVDKEADFGMYKDNYIITGIPTNKPTNKETADVKFQFSIRHRMLKGTLPFNSFLMLTYTQKSFWDVYRDSAPFADSNYNPGFMLGAPVTQHGKLRGMLALSLEHESNGRDGDASRSWNFIGLSGAYLYNRYFWTQVKFWIPQVSQKDNPDLLKYRGIGFVALNYRSFTDRFAASVVLNPAKKGLNTRIELAARVTKRANYYFFLQWEQGYSESLLRYKEYNSMVRLGIALKPPMRSIF